MNQLDIWPVENKSSMEEPWAATVDASRSIASISEMINTTGNRQKLSSLQCLSGKLPTSQTTDCDSWHVPLIKKIEPRGIRGVPEGWSQATSIHMIVVQNKREGRIQSQPK